MLGQLDASAVLQLPALLAGPALAGRVAVVAVVVALLVGCRVHGHTLVVLHFVAVHARDAQSAIRVALVAELDAALGRRRAGAVALDALAVLQLVALRARQALVELVHLSAVVVRVVRFVVRLLVLSLEGPATRVDFAAPDRRGDTALVSLDVEVALLTPAGAP